MHVNDVQILPLLLDKEFLVELLDKLHLFCLSAAREKRGNEMRRPVAAVVAVVVAVDDALRPCKGWEACQEVEQACQEVRGTTCMPRQIERTS